MHGTVLKFCANDCESAVVLVFSTIDRESFLAVKRLYAQAHECGVQRFVLVQNKIDKLEETKVTK